MVEVFKTDVKTKRQAKTVINLIHKSVSFCSANFDLDDCDKILRIKYTSDSFRPSYLLDVLKNAGINATMLKDEESYSEQELHLTNYSLNI